MTQSGKNNVNLSKTLHITRHKRAEPTER